MRTIRTTTVHVDTTGVDSTAAGAGSSEPLTGELLDIYLNFNSGGAATTDTTISETTFGNIMVLTDSCTDGRYAPRMPIHTTAAAAITNGSDRYPLSDSVITFTLAQANVDTDALIATIRWATDF